MDGHGSTDRFEALADLQSVALQPSAPETPAQGDDIQCPSYQIEEATGVLGHLRRNGTLEIFESVLPMPNVVRSTLVANGALQTTRFVGPCVQDECMNWNEGCQLGKSLSRLSGHAHRAYPDCSIRSQCRWFLENGPSACDVCISVTYDGRWPRPRREEAPC